MKGLYEILTEKKWMVSPDFVHGIRKALETNLNTHAAFTKPEKTCGFVTAVSADGSIYYPEEYQISEDGNKAIGQWALSVTDEQGNSMQNFPFVSVLSVDGPVTRNGGGCSYGSIDHRDMMIKAANHPLCCGHIFILNTPGGSAWAKNDYEQAINYARSKGQPVIAFIDGMCASAGMYLAALCDERYYMHPKNQIGCIGVMAAFYTEADGSKNQFTNETYHELYDPESFEKNKAFRDIANDNNSEELVKELADLGVEFRADVKKACPQATEEHIHGKVFDAETVKGILMDDQSTFADCVKRCFAIFRNEATPIVREVATEGEADAGCKPKKCEDINNASNSLPTGEGRGEASNNTIHMNNYPLTQAALGCEELVVSEEGAFVNTPLLDNCEAHLAEKDAAKAEAEQKLADAEKALADAQAHAKEIEEQLATAQTMAEEAQKALTEAKEAHAVETEAHNAALTKVTNEMAEQMKEMQGIKDALATAEQTLADKDAQIQALTAQPAEPQAQGEAPKSNGDAPEAPKFACNAPQYDPSLSPKENRRIMAEYRASLMK